MSNQLRDLKRHFHEGLTDARWLQFAGAVCAVGRSRALGNYIEVNEADFSNEMRITPHTETRRSALGLFILDFPFNMSVRLTLPVCPF